VEKQVVLTKLKDCIEEIRQRFSVRTLAIFGSIARDEADDNSDVDVLVVFDLVTDKALRPQVRRIIEGELVNVT